MTNLTIIQQSPDPEQVAERSRTRRSIADKIRGMGQNRIGALLLLLATVVAILWANFATASYEAFWETHLTIGVGDLQLEALELGLGAVLRELGIAAAAAPPMFERAVARPARR